MSYDYRFDWAGWCELSDGERTIYLQPGDDCQDIRDLDDWLDTTEFPFGPYESSQDAIDTILSEYFACIDPE